MDFLKLLEHSYNFEREINECPPESRLEFLSESIFDFTTYASDKSELFARKAVEVCAAINGRKTFEYIENDDNHTWYLLMCNMPFFADKLEWGTSIRGVWWDFEIEFQSFGLWVGEDQHSETMKFTQEEWKRFIAAVIEFSATP